jgi:hypothetical protein
MSEEREWIIIVYHFCVTHELIISSKLGQWGLWSMTVWQWIVYLGRSVFLAITLMQKIDKAA